MTKRRSSLVGALAAVVVGFFAVDRSETGALAAPVTAQEVKKTVWDGIYTEEQATRGEQTYKQRCGYCHRDNLRGGFFDDGVGMAPALAGSGAFGSSFSGRWSELTVGEMFDVIATTMPQNEPASLSPQAYIDIISFLLKMNEIPAGGTELSTDSEHRPAARPTYTLPIATAGRPATGWRSVQRQISDHVSASFGITSFDELSTMTRS